MKPSFFYIIAILLSYCFFPSLFAQSDCDSLTRNGPQIRYLIKKDLPDTAEKEEEIYKSYNPVIIPEYFLLGVLPEERLGPRFNTSYPLASYHLYEENKVDFLKDYIQQHFNIQILIKNDSVRIYIYSRGLVIILT